MIPTDPADIWGNAISMGNAELAAVLTPVKRFDRRGSVLWWTSFEDGLAQVSAGTDGVGADVYPSAAEAKSGAYSVKLIGGSDGTKWASVLKSLSYTKLGLVGFESGVLVNTTVDYIQWSIIHWDGTAGKQYTIQWTPSTETLVYIDSASAPQTISTDVPYVASGSLWNLVKLVVDIENDVYERVLFDDQLFPLTNIAGEPYAGAGSRFIQVEAVVISRAANNDYIWVDDYIVTQNEPAN